MKLLAPALLLASSQLAEAACKFEFWQYDNWQIGYSWHAYMVRIDVSGDNMNFPKMIDDFCSIFHKINGNGAVPSLRRECIRDSDTSGHARTDLYEGWDGVLGLHQEYLTIIDQLKYAGYGICEFVNHAAF